MECLSVLAPGRQCTADRRQLLIALFFSLDDDYSTLPRRDLCRRIIKELERWFAMLAGDLILLLALGSLIDLVRTA